MIKKTITYVDYEGVERTEDFHFHLNKAEIIKINMTTPGGMVAKLNQITKAKDTAQLYEVFEDLVHKSFGVKTPDGRGFTKDADTLKAFTETEAYSKLIVELVTDADKAAKFFNGIIPNDEKQLAAKN